jgi:hypothetical protein
MLERYLWFETAMPRSGDQKTTFCTSIVSVILEQAASSRRIMKFAFAS